MTAKLAIFWINMIAGLNRFTNQHKDKTTMTGRQLPIALLHSIVTLMILAQHFAHGAENGQLPDPDGKPADMSKPVQVYVLLGQSNMLGFGKVNGGDGSLEHAVKEKKLYPYLVDDGGNWTERKDVRNVRVMGSGTGDMKLFNNEWMTITGKNHWT